MTLHPILPVQPDESLTSYMRRVAHFHGGMSDVYTFLAAFGLSRASLIEPDPDILGRIAGITGQPGDTLRGMAIRSVKPRVRALGHEEFFSEFVNFKQTSFCPACLLADQERGSPSAGLRVGRVSWRIAPVRTCPHHNMGLVRTSITSKPQRFQHMDEVAPDNDQLARLVDAAEHRAPSVLQDYILARLAGQRGPAWLDAQPIDLAVRACEMLGLLLTHEVTVKLPDATAAGLDAAGAIGFDHATQGEEGVWRALSDIHGRAADAGFRGGPQQVFGFFHAWLQETETLKPKGPIRDVAQTYVMDHFAIAPGTLLYGELVAKERKHTVHSLARKLGAAPRTVCRTLVLGGLLDGDPERPDHHAVFDAAEGEALFTRVNMSLSRRELQRFLNCHRTQAEQLVKAGILPRIVVQAGRGKNAAWRVARHDAEDLLANMIAAAKHVGPATEGMCDVPKASLAAGWSVVDVVRALLAGRFRNVACADPGLGFLGVLLDPVEVRAVLNQGQSGDLVGFDEATRLLGIKRYGMRKFLSLHDADGKPLLRTLPVADAEGRPVSVVSRSDIMAFLDSHVSLTEIAARMGTHVRHAKDRLAKAGTEPVNNHTGIGRTFYRRDDVRQFFAL